MTTMMTERSEIVTPNVYLKAGMPGFPAAQRFTLKRWGPDDSPFLLMTSMDIEGLSFVVVQPAIFFPNYLVEIDDGTAERLGITETEDTLSLVILTLGDTPQAATANLLAPLVINRHTGHAAQVVLPAADMSIRQPLTA
jgi:flagellar assembly factor FliW